MTSTTNDAKKPKGTWRCYLCQPTVQDEGGQRAYYKHWHRVHDLTPKERP